MGFWSVLGIWRIDWNVARVCVCVWREGITPNQDNKWHRNYLRWYFCAWKTSLSFPCTFRRQNNRSSDANCKILMEDSTVRPRSRIGLENVWAREIDVQQEIEGDGMKVVSWAICCLEVRVSKWCILYREWCIKNGILHERKTAPNGERFPPWLHLKCARLWMPRHGLDDRDNDRELGHCLLWSSLHSSPLDLAEEWDQTRWGERLGQKIAGCWFPIVDAREVVSVVWMRWLLRLQWLLVQCPDESVHFSLPLPVHRSKEEKVKGVSLLEWYVSMLEWSSDCSCVESDCSECNV